MALTLSGCWLISTMPPALSEMGPKTSIVSTYAAVDSIPIVATAVPNRPSALELVRPAGANTGVRTLLSAVSAAMLKQAGVSLSSEKGTAGTWLCRLRQQTGKPADNKSAQEVLPRPCSIVSIWSTCNLSTCGVALQLCGGRKPGELSGGAFPEGAASQ